MADRGDADSLLTLGQLVEDSIGADPQGAQASQSASERVSGIRFALEQAESVLDRVDQGPVEFEQLAPGAAGKNEPCQGSAGGRPALGQLAAKLGERDRFVPANLGEASLQRG